MRAVVVIVIVVTVGGSCSVSASVSASDRASSLSRSRSLSRNRKGGVAIDEANTSIKGIKTNTHNLWRIRTSKLCAS